MDQPDWRRRLSRELTRQSRLDAAHASAEHTTRGGAFRIGLTGPPGAGKSTLIAGLAKQRLDRGREIGVLAIDPTSPVFHGSLLGDRIRMDAIANDSRLFIRSVPSGPCHDGLCHNVAGLLATIESAGFNEVILETVGVGQVSYEVRNLVDTLVLVLVPESGDTIQAMKAGILEVADIYVVNKADRPGAERLAAEITAILRRRGTDQWTPPVILTALDQQRGLAELDEAIEAHRSTLSETPDVERAKNRRRYVLRALLRHRFDELVASGWVDQLGDRPAPAQLNELLRRMKIEE